MRASLLRDRNQVTLPEELVEAAGLVPQQDYIAWRFESGEIRGRKQSHAPDRTGRVARDRKTGLLFWDGDISAEEAENAALSARGAHVTFNCYETLLGRADFPVLCCLELEGRRH